MKRVALGLSGGVDSAVSAYLLKQQGYDVSCFHLICFDIHAPGLRSRGSLGPRGCRGDQDRKDALAVALHLGLPFQVLDFQKEYQKAVIEYFKSEYVAGRTPNPDVVCNSEIKFGLFYDWAMKRGFDFISTGHYARIFKGPTLSTQGRTLSDVEMSFCISKDLHKDQTYFLWQVPRERFEHILFPLGDLLKSEVRAIAKKIKLPVAEKKDSTGICFIGEVRVEDFLKRLGVKEEIGEVVIKSTKYQASNLKKSNGNFKIRNSKLFGVCDLEFDASENYEVIGRHRGVAFYTIGQRHGFSVGLWPPKRGEEGKGKGVKGIEQKFNKLSFYPFPSSFFPLPSLDCPPLYVIEKDVKRNRLVVGFGAECYRDQFVISDCNWLISEKVRPFDSKRSDLRAMNCFVRIRHGGELIPCAFEKVRPSRTGRSDLKKFLIRLSSAQRGVAPGQSAVFYDKNGVVLGGGVIR